MATPTVWLSEFQVNTGTAATGSQNAPQIIGLNNGYIVVAWEEIATGQNSPAGAAAPARGTDIVVKIFDAEGNVVRDASRLNGDRNGDDEQDFDLTATHDGFALTYIDDSINNVNQTTVYYERFDFDGIRLFGAGTGVSIADENVAADFLRNPQVAANLIAANDDVLVAYDDKVGTADTDVNGKVIDQAGVDSAEFDVGSNSSGVNTLGDVAVLSNGNFVAVYEEEDTVTGIEFRIFTPAGSFVSNVNVTDAFGSGAPASDPAVTSLDGGGFVVTWVEGNDILIRGYSNTGTSLFVETIAAGGTASQNEPVVVALPDGDFVVFWDDDTANNLQAQRFNANGTTDGSAFVVSGPGRDVEIGVTGDGRILFTWEKVSGGEIFASIWDPRGSTIDPDDYNVELANILDSNVITTGTGNTTVLAASDNEDYFVFGQGGNDAIFSNGFGEYLGGAGNDTITAGGGTEGTGREELLDGGIGTDTLNLSGQTGAYDINLTTGVTQFNSVVVTEESFINFENVNTGSGNNTIVGTAGDNVINAGAGNDTVDGGAGNDTINGGDGDDMLVGGSGNNTLIGGDGNDTLDGTGGNPDNLSGGAGDDLMLLGGGVGDVVNGGAGIDTLDYSTPVVSGAAYFYDMNAGNGVSLGSVGGFFFTTIVDEIENLITISGANDTVVGNALANVITTGEGDDTVDGGAGNDTINGGDGDDMLVGGAGNNTLIGGNGNDTLDGTGGSPDNLSGGAGDDLMLLGGGSGDVVNGGAGIDTLDYSPGSGSGPYFYNMNAGNGVSLASLNAGFFTTIVDDIENLITISGADAVVLGNALANVITTGTGDDTVNGGAGSDTIFLGDGDDTATSSGIDAIFGEAGDDLIFAGNALLFPPTSAETLDGGTGIDTLDTTSFNGAYIVNLATGLTNFTGESFTNFENIISGNGSDELFGTSGANVMEGGGGNDRILGLEGNDTLRGGGGNDILNGGIGNDNLRGDANEDRLFGREGNDDIDGGSGDDLLVGNEGNDDLDGGGGNDAIRGGTGVDVIDGGDGDDEVFGGDGNDEIEGGEGDDLLDGSAGNDEIYGEEGNDTLVGQIGEDELFGGIGNDELRGGGGDDFLNGESGNDTLFGGANEDTLFGGSGDDFLQGNQQDDALFGQTGNDRLFGGDGFDFLDGGSGNDRLEGNNGRDTLVGGLGADILIGGDLGDTFDFNNVSESNLTTMDTIVGIDGIGVANGDIIDVSTIDANTLLGGNQAFTFLGLQSTAAALSFGAGALWVENAGGPTMLFGNIDNDAVIEFAVQINDGAGISAADYTVGDFIV